MGSWWRSVNGGKPARGCGESESVGNQPMGGVVWRNTYLDPIVGHHPNPMLLQPSRKNASDQKVVFALNFHGAAAQYPGDRTHQFNEVFATQWTPFLMQRVK